MNLPSFKLIIEWTEDGKVNVTGPLQEEVLCLGLLEKAKQAILESNKQKNNFNKPVSAFPFGGVSS